MANVNFYLKTTKNIQGKQLIVMYVSFDKLLLRYSVKEHVKKANWSKVKKRVKPSITGSFEINSLLDDYETEALLGYRQLKLKRLTPVEIKEKLRVHLDKSFSRQKLGDISDFYVLYDNFLEDSRDKHTDATRRDYSALKGHLVELEKRNGKKISLGEIDKKFYENLCDYFFDDCDFYNNTVGKYITKLKAFLNWTTKNELNEKLDYKKFKIWKETKDIYPLTNEDLDKFLRLELDGSNERVRDIFVLGCATGLRYSDLKDLKATNLRNDEIVLFTEKTDVRVAIPLTKHSRAIFEKYKNKIGFLKSLTGSMATVKIKEIGKMAGLDNEVSVTRYKRKKQYVTTHKRYEILGMHDARRTFICRAFENGVEERIIMKVTGIRNRLTLDKYLKVTSKKVKDQIGKAFD